MTYPWKDKITFLEEPQGIKHSVRGQEITFYQMSPRMVLQLKSISRPLAQALSVLFRNKKGDSDATYRDFTDSNTGEVGSETEQKAINPDTLAILLDRKAAAIDQIISAFSEESNLILLVKIIFDSCRDVFPRKPSPEELSAFLEEAGVDVGVLVQFLIGVAKANVRTLGPLADRVSETFSTKMQEAMEGVLETQTPTPTSSPTESESSQASPFAQPTPGPTSKT